MPAADARPADLHHGPDASSVPTVDWAATPLGPPEGWPEPLRLAATLATDMPTPAAVAWGPDLIAVPNLAMTELVGARAIGIPLERLFAESGSRMDSLSARALSGEGVWEERVAIGRSIDDTPIYGSLTLSPVRAGDGTIGGLFVQCAPSPAAPAQPVPDSEAHYRALFESMEEGFCVIEFFDGPHGPLSDLSMSRPMPLMR